MRGLETVDPAVRRRPDDRAVGLSADCERNHPGRYRGGRAARGAAWRALHIVRIPGLSRSINRELGRDGLAEDDRPRLTQQGNRPRVFGWPPSRMQHGAVLCRHIVSVEDVFDPNRNTVQRTERLAVTLCLIGSACLLQCVVAVEVGPCLHARLKLLDPFETRTNELLARDSAVPNERRRLKRA